MNLAPRVLELVCLLLRAPWRECLPASAPADGAFERFTSRWQTPACLGLPFTCLALFSKSHHCVYLVQQLSHSLGYLLSKSGQLVQVPALPLLIQLPAAAHLAQAAEDGSSF